MRDDTAVYWSDMHSHDSAVTSRTRAEILEMLKATLDHARDGSYSSDYCDGLQAAIDTVRRGLTPHLSG